MCNRRGTSKPRGDGCSPNTRRQRTWTSCAGEWVREFAIRGTDALLTRWLSVLCRKSHLISSGYAGVRWRGRSLCNGIACDWEKKTSSHEGQ